MDECFQIRRREDGTALLTLTRPDRNNAFDDVLIRELAQALRDLGDAVDVTAVVIAGEGKNFCAGADLAWMKRAANYGQKDNLADATNLALLMYTLNQLPKPTIARVQGAAYGGGVGLVACCDVAIATEDARFCLSEVRLGLVPAVVSPYVVAAIGGRASRRFFQTAEVFSAVEAQTLGLVHEVVAKTEIDARIDELLRQLNQGAPQAKASAKALVHNVTGRLIDSSLLDDTACLIADIRARPEAREGLTAFLERRSPAWT